MSSRNLLNFPSLEIKRLLKQLARRGEENLPLEVAATLFNVKKVTLRQWIATPEGCKHPKNSKKWFGLRELVEIVRGEIQPEEIVQHLLTPCAQMGGRGLIELLGTNEGIRMALKEIRKE